MSIEKTTIKSISYSDNKKYRYILLELSNNSFRLHLESKDSNIKKIQKINWFQNLKVQNFEIDKQCSYVYILTLEGYLFQIPLLLLYEKEFKAFFD